MFEGRSIPDQEQVFNATKSIEIHNTGSTRDFWIGMNDDSVEEEWRYDSDNTLVRNWALPKWTSSTPDIDDTKNCAWIRRFNSYRTDSSCNNVKYFICEESFIGKKKQIMKLMTYDIVMM